MLGADVVSHGMAWSGGPPTIRFLEDDWVYHKNDITGNDKYNYELSRAKAVIKANKLCEEDFMEREPLTVSQTKEVFGYFAKRMGLSQKR